MGSVVRTTCDANQGELQGGETIRTCQANGTWSGPEPTHCGCPVLGDLELAGTSIAFSHDAKMLCVDYRWQPGTNDHDRTALWDIEAALCVRSIKAPRAYACAFSPATDLLATGGLDHPVVFNRQALVLITQTC